jgi:hypothetical protein
MRDSNMSTSSHSDPEREIKWSEWLRDRGFGRLFGLERGRAHPFDTIVWSPGDPDREAAWKLYTELRTRITTQPLAYRAGDEATALDSVYRLFDLSRTVIKEHNGCTHFAALTVRVLNRCVRPFTAKWHRQKVDGRLSSADVKFDFRRELLALQPSLRDFTHLLGLLAGDLLKVVESEAEPTLASGPAIPNLWNALPFGIAVAANWTESVPSGIITGEREEIKKRRTLYSLSNADANTDAVGLSISGGGIRSATFALGVLQELARRGIAYQIDYLSTVSGGGYLGSFLSSFLNDADNQVTLKPEKGALPFGSEFDGESQGVRQLRNHSKYLSEGGFKTLATIAGLVIYGLLVSVLLVIPFLLSGVLIAALFFERFFRNPPTYPGLSSEAVGILFVLSVGVLFLPLIQRFGGRTLKRCWGIGCVSLALLGVFFLAAEALPHIFWATWKIHGPSGLLASTVLSPLLFGGLGLWLGASSRLGRIMFGLFTVVGPLIMVAAFLWLLKLFITDPSHPSIFVLVTLTASTWLYATFVLDINNASPHQFYRNRVARTFLARNMNGGAAVQSIDPQMLSGMNESGKAPYHLINCALNIPSCTDPNLRGRNTDFFLFSKLYCGSPITGFHSTQDWEAMDPHLDLGTAIAISGAAAAPHMGTLTSARYTFLLAMLNVRLGYWLRRPKPGSNAWLGWLRPPVGWYYFFLELSGFMSEKTRYLNLSDGGHIENLGIYELLRRRCKFIIAIDGEADPKRSFGGLLTLTQFAKIDLGVTIEPDLTDLRIDRSDVGRAHFGLCRIDYPDENHGLLLYIKSSLTGNESEFLKKYHADNPDFPHQSTAEQLYSETQFEAYRALGEHIACDLFREDLVGKWENRETVRDWFERLASQLLS